MVPVKGPLQVLLVRNEAPRVSRMELTLPPCGTDVILGSCAYKCGVFTIPVQVDLNFSLSPPAILYLGFALMHILVPRNLPFRLFSEDIKSPCPMWLKYPCARNCENTGNYHPMISTVADLYHKTMRQGRNRIHSQVQSLPRF